MYTLHSVRKTMDQVKRLSFRRRKSISHSFIQYVRASTFVNSELNSSQRTTAKSGFLKIKMITAVPRLPISGGSHGQPKNLESQNNSLVHRSNISARKKSKRAAQKL